ncbi:MAG: DUF3291 domain-containing protein [Pseudomonadota bacterium]
MHLAQFNIGTLKYDWDDPRVADFANNLDRVNGIARRSSGFVWQLPEEAMEAAQLDPDGPLGGNPRIASTLSVWEDAQSLENFVWNTVHKQFYDRKHEWYDPAEQGVRLVMWWVAPGHHPSIDEAAARLDHLSRHGDSDHAFGWAHLAGARRWKSAQCGKVA